MRNVPHSTSRTFLDHANAAGTGLIMSPDAGWYRVPGNLKILKPGAVQGSRSRRLLAVGWQENLRCLKSKAHKVGRPAEPSHHVFLPPDS